MKKQIFAIVLCTVLILTTFAACGKKRLVITDKEGHTYFAVTDENGETMINEDGDIVIYNTDPNGDAVTKEGGEIETNGYSFPAHLPSKDKYETPDFVWELSGKSWDIQERIIKSKKNSTTIQISNLGDMEFDKTILESQEQLKDLTAEQKELLKPENKAFDIPGVKSGWKFSMDFDTKDEEAKYVQNYYFDIHGVLYQITVMSDLKDKETSDFDNMFEFFHVKSF